MRQIKPLELKGGDDPNSWMIQIYKYHIRWYIYAGGSYLEIEPDRFFMSKVLKQLKDRKFSYPIKRRLRVRRIALEVAYYSLGYGYMETLAQVKETIET